MLNWNLWLLFRVLIFISFFQSLAFKAWVLRAMRMSTWSTICASYHLKWPGDVSIFIIQSARKEREHKWIPLLAMEKSLFCLYNVRRWNHAPYTAVVWKWKSCVRCEKWTKWHADTKTYLAIEYVCFAFLNDGVDFQYERSITHIYQIVHWPIIDIIINVRRHSLEFILGPANIYQWF